jgi:geranylgeranyl transferase type-2 subunit beta
MSYLEDLTLRLVAGAMRLPEDVRGRHAVFVAHAQNEDGGFAGRQGPSDPYYTGFALRGLAVASGLSESVASRAGRFLTQRLADEISIIDFVSLVFSAVLLENLSGIDVFADAGCDRTHTVAAMLDRFRRSDGGYAKNDRSPHSSTYHTFLAGACKQLVGLPVDDAAEMAHLVRTRNRDDGGFVELGPLRQSGTNPTAAGVGLLRLAGCLDEPTRGSAAEFLKGMQTAEGGFRANRRIPVADLLSTFTAMVTLADLDALAHVELGRVRRYAEALQQPQGGFRGGVWDDAADVEYTFYGLGTLALLASLNS